MRLASSSNMRRGIGEQILGLRQGARRAPAVPAAAPRYGGASPAASRPPRPSTAATSSERTGTAISAAAVGVGARRSAAKSMSVKSVSWPTAEMSGIAEAAAARTTISSLKLHRSSRLPPPRATIRRSGRGNRAARREAR